MRMKAIWNGAVLAESDDTVVVEGNRYFPRASLAEEYVEPSRSRSVCPWKGVASYYSFNVDGQTNRDAAWEYKKPFPLGRRVKNRVAFWSGVQVVAGEGDTAGRVDNR